MRPVRRVLVGWTAIVCTAMAGGLGVAASAAHAAPSTTVWLGNYDTGDKTYFIAPGGELLISFGIRGPSAMSENVVIDATGTSGHLSLAQDGAQCTVSGKVVTCHPPDWSGAPEWTTGVRLVADAGTPLSELGSLVVRNEAGTSSARGTVWGQRPGVGADLQITTTTPTGSVGDTVQVQVTVRNLGPNPEPWWGLDPIAPKVATYVGISGCGPGNHSGTTFPCWRGTPQAVGTAVTFTLSYRIVGQAVYQADNSGGMGLGTGAEDPDPGNSSGYFVIRPAGSGGGAAPVGQQRGAGADGSGATGAGAGGAGSGSSGPEATPTSSTSPTAAAAPASGSVAAVSASGPARVATGPLSFPGTSPGRLAGLAALAVVVAAAGYLIVRYRRRSRAPVAEG